MVDAELGHGLMVLEDGWKLEWRLSAGASVDRSGSDVGCRARVRRWQRWCQQVSSEGEVEQSLAVRRHYCGRVRRVRVVACTARPNGEGDHQFVEGRIGNGGGHRSSEVKRAWSEVDAGVEMLMWGRRLCLLTGIRDEASIQTRIGRVRGDRGAQRLCRPAHGAVRCRGSVRAGAR